MDKKFFFNGTTVEATKKGFRVTWQLPEGHAGTENVVTINDALVVVWRIYLEILTVIRNDEVLNSDEILLKLSKVNEKMAKTFKDIEKYSKYLDKEKEKGI